MKSLCLVNALHRGSFRIQRISLVCSREADKSRVSRLVLHPSHRYAIHQPWVIVRSLSDGCQIASPSTSARPQSSHEATEGSSGAESQQNVSLCDGMEPATKRPRV